MKTYSVKFTIAIHDKATSYPEVRPIDIDVRENLPANVCPQKYLRQRISEELKRNFDSLALPIDNREDGAAEDDALA